MRNFSTLILAVASNAAFAQAPCIANTNSLNFSGSSYVQIPADPKLDINDVVTIEAWVYPTQFALTSAQNTIVCKHGWSQQQAGYVLRAGGTGVLSFNFGDGALNGWHEIMSPNNALVLNTWKHVAGSYDGDSLKLYVNGIEVASLQFTGTIANSSGYNMRIGSLSDPINGPGRYWSGRMDEIRVWHSVRTAAEILANYNQHLDTAGVTNLVAYWRMNEGTGTTLGDMSGNTITGTFVGGNTWSTQVPFNEVPATPGIINNGGLLASTITTGNQWFLNGNPIPGANGQFYTPIAPGTYTVQQTSPQGCTAISNSVIITNQGVNENASANGIQIIPNPAHDFIFIQLEKSNALKSIELCDVNGRIIFNEKIINHDKIKFDVHDFDKGVYMVRMIFNDHVATQKIIID